MEFKQYDTVRVVEILNPEKARKSGFGLAAPRVGDVATIIEIYTSPCLGYELECSDEHGITQWLVAFEPEEIKLVRV